MRAEYERKLKDLEREREAPGAGAAEKLERFTQLLLKQREIMLALTAKLRRRDDQILVLQQELEAFDGHQKWTPPLHFTLPLTPTPHPPSSLTPAHPLLVYVTVKEE